MSEYNNIHMLTSAEKIKISSKIGILLKKNDC